MWLFGAGGTGGTAATAAGAAAVDAAPAAAAAGTAAGAGGVLSTLGNAALGAGGWLGQQALGTPVGQLGQLAYQGGSSLADLIQGNYGVGTDLPPGISGAGPASGLSSQEAGLMQPHAGTFPGIQAVGPAASQSTAPLTTRSDLVQGILQGFDLESPIQDMAGVGTQNRVQAPPLSMPGQLQGPAAATGNAGRVGLGMNGLLTWMPHVPQTPAIPQIPGALPPLTGYRGQ